MARRKYPLITDHFYHVFNKSIDGRPIFTNKRECSITLQMVKYYQVADERKVSFSKFRLWAQELRNNFYQVVYKNKSFLTEIVAFCLMPNHYHFLLKQIKDDGISKFLSDFQNSFTRFYNIKHERKGHLFTGPFKAVLIENESQLIHVSRYIHLNPLTSYLLKEPDDLNDYLWSSYPEYVGLKESKISNPEYVLSQFKNSSDYNKFVLDQVDYQRDLEQLKHLLLN